MGLTKQTKQQTIFRHVTIDEQSCDSWEHEGAERASRSPTAGLNESLFAGHFRFGTTAARRYSRYMTERWSVIHSQVYVESSRNFALAANFASSWGDKEGTAAPTSPLPPPPPPLAELESSLCWHIEVIMCLCGGRALGTVICADPQGQSNCKIDVYVHKCTHIHTYIHI